MLLTSNFDIAHKQQLKVKKRPIIEKAWSPTWGALAHNVMSQLCVSGVQGKRCRGAARVELV
jgi:hypothetical protein